MTVLDGVNVPPVVILGIILFGMMVGAFAQWVLGATSRGVDWGMALVSGLAGSFVGGLLYSLLAGDGFSIEPSGLLGSIAGALIVSGLWIKFGSTKSASR